MAACSDALTGNDWQSQLVYVHYQGKEVSSRTCYLNYHLPGGLIPPTSDQYATIGMVASITAFTIDLSMNFAKISKKLLTHHFIEVETDNGFIFTFEKNKSGILIQSSRSQLEDSMQPNRRTIVQEFNDGKKRKRLDTVKLISIDLRPKRCYIADIVKWIHENGELAQKYHVVEANCQHFVGNLWRNFASAPFPIPAQYGVCQPASPAAVCQRSPSTEGFCSYES